ncbi:hypothetical protein DFJ73DRAFT_370837 [Zopfochytrium polystomum]|nr:hypothetical protein DFJ73DRAFT_370837 [Zopfochytrium polystomum]
MVGLGFAVARFQHVRVIAPVASLCRSCVITGLSAHGGSGPRSPPRCAPGGCRFSVQLSFGLPRPWPGRRRLVANGEAGGLNVESGTSPPILLTRRGQSGKRRAFRPSATSMPRLRGLRLQDCFFDAALLDFLQAHSSTLEAMSNTALSDLIFFFLRRSSRRLRRSEHSPNLGVALTAGFTAPTELFSLPEPRHNQVREVACGVDELDRACLERAPHWGHCAACRA